MITKDKELFEKFQKLNPEYHEKIEFDGWSNPKPTIINLISMYESYKYLLLEKEYELDKTSLEYEDQFLILKEQYLKKFKSTEAKEHAHNDLKESKLQLLSIEKQISILKACIHTCEYQLRLKFLQYKELIYNGK